MASKRPRSGKRASITHVAMFIIISLTLLPLAILAMRDERRAARPAATAAAAAILLSADAVVLPVSTGQARIRAIVRDTRGAPLSGALVQFHSTFGNIAPSEAATDSKGIATATFATGATPGQAVITAVVNGLKQQVYLQINDPASTQEGQSLTLLVDDRALNTDERTRVVVTLRGTDGQPLSDELVTLFGSLGELAPASAITDADGQVMTTFTAGSVAGQARLTVLTGYASTSTTVQIQGTTPKHGADIYLPLVSR